MSVQTDRTPRILGACWLACVLVMSPFAAAHANGPQDYVLDPVHTRVLFAIEHAGFSKALGTVSGSTGTLRFDRDDWTSARLDVRVPILRLDLGDTKWYEAVVARNLLDAKRYPEARFVSSSVETIDAKRAKVCGDFTLHGVTNPLCMDVTLNAVKRHPLPPFRRTAGFSATATLSRKAFGIDAWPSVIGDTVDLRIEVEAVRGRKDGNATDPEPADDAQDSSQQADTDNTPAQDKQER